MMREGSAASVLGRIGPPVLKLLLVTAAAGMAYQAAWRIPIRAIHQAVSAAAIGVYFAGLGFGTLYVWIACTGRGASTVERVLACAIVPFLWMTKEVIRVGQVWPLPDALFFYLNPLHVTMACVAIEEMGLAELILRRRRRSRGEAVRVLSAGPLAAFLLPQLIVWPFTALPERAAATFFVFLKLYARIVHGTSLEY
jgi:hypothetical protein